MLERTDQLELANVTILRLSSKNRQCRKARSNIAKELLQSRPRGSAGVFDKSLLITTNAYLAPRQPTVSLQREYGSVTLSLRLKGEAAWRRSFAMAHPSRGC